MEKNPASWDYLSEVESRKNSLHFWVHTLLYLNIWGVILQFSGENYRLEQLIVIREKLQNTRGGSRAVATSKMERFVIIINGWKALTIITKRFIWDVAAALDPPLNTLSH